jgi:uncharacterized protein YqhQ
MARPKAHSTHWNAVCTFEHNGIICVPDTAGFCRLFISLLLLIFSFLLLFAIVFSVLIYKDYRNTLMKVVFRLKFINVVPGGSGIQYDKANDINTSRAIVTGQGINDKQPCSY